MTIGSLLPDFNRFSASSGPRASGVMDDAANNGNLAGAQDVNNPARVGEPWTSENGKDAANGKNAKTGTKKGRFDKNECETCKNRRYQDGSDDPGVSFKAPTKMTPEQAATAVMGHEMEHVTRNQAEARATGREVISQSVTLHTDICPECGRVFIAGGETRTVTAERKDRDSEQKAKFDVGKEDPSKQSGQQLDAVA